MRRVVAVLALVFFAACDSITNLQYNEVEGTWRGVVAGQTLTLSLQQSGQTLAGSGTLVNTAPASTTNLSLSGDYTKPTLTLTLLPFGGGSAISLEGLVEGDSFVGNLSGGAFTSAAIAMARLR